MMMMMLVVEGSPDGAQYRMTGTPRGTHFG